MAIPCDCGCDLQTATKIIAVIDIVAYCFLALSTILGGIYLVAESMGHKTQDHVFGRPISEANTLSLVIAFCLALLVCIAGVCLGLYLRKGAKTRSYKSCRNWLIITLILLVFDAIQFLASIGPSPAAKLALNGVMLGYRICAAWIVYEFIQELKSTRAQAISAVSTKPATTGAGATTTTSQSDNSNANVV